MEKARDEVYSNLHKNKLDGLLIRRRHPHEARQAAFRRVYNGTKFGRCVRTMVEWNEDMLFAGKEVRSFKFIPKDQGTKWFDCEVEFEVVSSEVRRG